MKVFISYSRKDATTVERLKTALEAGKVGVTIDTESLAFGEDLHEFVERSVRETDLTIAVISRQSLQSVWVIAEALETLVHEKVLGQKKFLPIFIDRCFLDYTFQSEIVEATEKSLDVIRNEIQKLSKKYLPTTALDIEKTRLCNLRFYIDEILRKLRESLVADFSSKEKIAKNLPKLLEAIAQAETQHEQVTGRPSRYLAPFQAPPLPGHFVPRPDVTDVLKARLLNTNSTTPGILVVSAIHGLGGIGKSTLAAALAHDYDDPDKKIHKRFPDGILWATLGQQPDILSLMNGWIQAMRDYDFRPTTLETASAHLRTLLHDKAVLLVVDDVWQPEHAKHFKVGGPRCQVLITTRRVHVADDLGAELHQMDVMRPEQALELLSTRLGKGKLLEGTEKEEALLLAEIVGYLPLALELAAVRVMRGMSWKALQQALKQEIDRLEVLDNTPQKRKEETTLEACFNLSLNTLRNDNEEAWQAFVWLGVLPEDVQIAAPMAATFWDKDEAEADRILELLWNDALLLRNVQMLIGEKKHSSYRLHDLLHDVAHKLLSTSQPRGLGLTYQDAHAILLERYKQGIQNHRWHTLPDDGYIHNYLTWHFQQAGQTEHIHNLLQEETPEGRNGWYQVREQSGQTAGFIADVNFAWNLAKKTQNVALQCRYALIITSINSLIENIPASLIIALLEKRIWNLTQGMTYIYRMSDPIQRIGTLIWLAKNSKNSLRSRALREISEIISSINSINIYRRTTTEEQESQSQILENLIYQLVELDAVEEAIIVVQKIENEKEQIKILMALLPSLSEPLKAQSFQKILSLIQSQIVWGNRDEVLLKLSYRLAKLGEPEYALTVAHQIKEKMKQVYMLMELFPSLSESLKTQTLPQILSIVQSQIVWWNRNMEPFPFLSEPLKTQTLQKILPIIQSQIALGNKDETLLKLSSRLADLGKTEHVLTVTKQIMGRKGRRKRDDDNQDIRLTAIYQNKEKQDLAQLAELGEHKKALTIAHQIKGKKEQVRALVDSLPYLPESLKGKTIQEILNAEEIKWYDPTLLMGLIPHLSEMLLPQVLEIIESIENSKFKSILLARLAIRWVELGNHNEALRSVYMIENRWSQAETLAKLVCHLPESLVKEALAVIRVIEDSEVCDEMVSELNSQLTHQINSGEKSTYIHNCRNAWYQVELLEKIAPHSPEVLLKEMLRTIQDNDFLKKQWRSSTKLISQLAELPYALILSSWKQCFDNFNSYIKKFILVIQGTDDLEVRCKLLSEMSFILSEIPSATLLCFWEELLDNLTRHTRKDFLISLHNLIPVINKLGGDEAISELCHAIQDVGRWWP